MLRYIIMQHNANSAAESQEAAITQGEAQNANEAAESQAA